MRHGLTNTRVYKIWKGIKRRCYNPNEEKYPIYGGRGITICDEWKNDAKSFCDWALANGYKEGLQIDRIDVNANYEPSNCRFVTSRVNALNKTNSTKHPGATYYKKCNLWRAQININNKHYHLGYFKTVEEATRCYRRTSEAFCE